MNNNIIYGGESHTGSLEYVDFTSLMSALPKTYIDMDSGNIIDQGAGTPSTSLIVEPPSFDERDDTPSLIEAYNELSNLYRDPRYFFDLDVSNILATIEDQTLITPPARLETPFAVGAPRASRLLNFSCLDLIEYPLESTQSEEDEELDTTIEWACPIHADYDFTPCCYCKEMMNQSMPDERAFKKMKRQ
jgi:hypothetical protein